MEQEAAPFVQSSTGWYVLKGTKPHERRLGDELPQVGRNSLRAGDADDPHDASDVTTDQALKRTPLATDHAGKPQTRFCGASAWLLSTTVDATQANKVARPYAMSVVGSESHERAAQPMARHPFSPQSSEEANGRP